ncbi:MAG: alpha-L-rhamnosidase, partial [Clostridia bacterium]|nr:alpha-L-rhamnosidase [Clostridia bacterium]
PLPKYMNAIYTYSMWWSIILADYYAEFGCADYIQKHLPYMTQLVEQMDELVDENGNLCNTIRYLVDWPTKDSPDEIVGVRAIFLMAMNGAEALMKDFGISTETVQKIKRKLMLQPLQVESKKQVIALKYFSTGELTDEDYAKLIEGRAKGFSTFMSYYVLTTIASRDEQLAIELMKEYYGAMLDRGATSFWEDFHIEWLEGSGRIDEIDDTKLDIHGDFGAHCYVGLRHSLCHGWSAGVAKFIKEHCKD